MQPLFEQYRPATFDDVVGQDKALAKLATLRKRGLSGRTYWITGASGTGKTTIARLIADELAEPWDTIEYDTPRQLSAKDIEAIRKSYRFRRLGRGTCYVVNEAHGLRRDQIERLLGATENAPEWVTSPLTPMPPALAVPPVSSCADHTARRTIWPTNTVPI